MALTQHVRDFFLRNGGLGFLVLGSVFLVVTGGEALYADMARWREYLFIFMSRNARNSTFFFGLPPNRVVELGAQLEI